MAWSELNQEGSELIHPTLAGGSQRWGGEDASHPKHTCASAEPGGFTAALNRGPSMAGCNCNSWFFLYSLSLYKFFEEKAFLLEVYMLRSLHHSAGR